MKATNKKIILEDVAKKIQSRIGGKFVSYKHVKNGPDHVIDNYEIILNMGDKNTYEASISLTKNGEVLISKTGYFSEVKLALANPDFDKLLNDELNIIINSMVFSISARLQNLLKIKRETCEEIPILQSFIKKFR